MKRFQKTKINIKGELFRRDAEHVDILQMYAANNQNERQNN